jgi:hypothetical protein
MTAYLIYRVIHLKRGPKYVCEFLQRQYNKTDGLFVSFCLLGGTYRTALQHLLEDRYQAFLSVFLGLCEVFRSQCWQQSVQCFSFSKFVGLFE